MGVLQFNMWWRISKQNQGLFPDIEFPVAIDHAEMRAFARAAFKRAVSRRFRVVFILGYRRKWSWELSMKNQWEKSAPNAWSKEGDEGHVLERDAIAAAVDPRGCAPAGGVIGAAGDALAAQQALGAEPGMRCT